MSKLIKKAKSVAKKLVSKAKKLTLKRKTAILRFTKEHLDALGVCGDGYRTFRKRFPRGVDVNKFKLDPSNPDEMYLLGEMAMQTEVGHALNKAKDAINAVTWDEHEEYDLCAVHGELHRHLRKYVEGSYTEIIKEWLDRYNNDNLFTTTDDDEGDDF